MLFIISDEDPSSSTNTFLKNHHIFVVLGVHYDIQYIIGEFTPLIILQILFKIHIYWIKN
jgi:hypothetical protein